MNIGMACAIFKNIESDKYTENEKGLAIMRVLSMETINSITKQELKNALAWLWNQHFEWVGEADE
jgi:hypothetical protein